MFNILFIVLFFVLLTELNIYNVCVTFVFFVLIVFVNLLLKKIVWYSLLFFLLYISGLVVLFIYVISLQPKPYNTDNLNYFYLFSIFLGLLFFCKFKINNSYISFSVLGYSFSLIVALYIIFILFFISLYIFSYGGSFRMLRYL